MFETLWKKHFQKIPETLDNNLDRLKRRAQCSINIHSDNKTLSQYIQLSLGSSEQKKTEIYLSIEREREKIDSIAKSETKLTSEND